MADSCVNHKHCGTAAPGWMNGGHPSVAERVVSRSVCFRSKSNCCKWSIVISVRNCGGFYVYWLQRPPHCNFRYCGSGIQPTSGTKRELYRLLHVAYRAVMAKKSTKKCAARAELLLCPIQTIAFSTFSLPFPWWHLKLLIFERKSRATYWFGWYWLYLFIIKEERPLLFFLLSLSSFPFPVSSFLVP